MKGGKFSSQRYGQRFEMASLQMVMKKIGASCWKIKHLRREMYKIMSGGEKMNQSNNKGTSNATRQ